MTSQTRRTASEPESVSAPSSAAPPSTVTSPDAAPGGRMGRVVAGSMAGGLLAGLLLVAAPFVAPEEDAVTGALLCGFAVGWAMLAVLSVRFTTAPQRWAAVPAAFMGLGGLLLIGCGPQVRAALDWTWPPVLLAIVVGIVVRIRGRLPSRTGRLLLCPVLAVLALASVGGGYETAREAMDAAAYPMPGRLVDIGGHGLHLHCTGSGGPTVVLEPGGGEMSSNLAWITPAVARDTRVCVYDRAGRGWSEPAATPQDGARTAVDLHALLHRADVPGPYVLAGHSFGGLYALAFAARYPDEVAGMVLVDSTAPAYAPAAPDAASRDGSAGDLVDRVSALASISARLGLVRAYNQFLWDGLPSQAGDEVRALGATAGNVRSTIDEYAQAPASMSEAAALRDFAGKPLFVLTAGAGHDAAWAVAQDHLATLSTDSVHRVVDGAVHEDLVADRDGAAATTRAIQQVVSAVRSGEPLTD
jgi:pimeloyl-ACP methyl ester carboxylesterase